jgi:tetratricopeptide (TPR) repeat protein
VYTITFYSFKGGVGRTMALVNVGLELVRRGRRVLLVDFDLEAPGLTTYEALRQQADHAGVVEYVTEYIRTKESPDISRFIYPVDLARVENRRKGRKGRKRLPKADHQESTGQLWVMPAGKGDAAYAGALAAINWNSLYEHLNGYLFFEDTKLQWREAIKPDYILIDSRTGHTDVGGICTRQLADAVVLLFTPNEQNLAGLEDVCRDIRREKTEGLEKEIRLHFVAANVPNLDDEHGLLRRQLEVFRKELAIYHEVPRYPRVVIHRYDSLEMLDQPVFVQQRPRSRLAREYRRLVRRLIMENPVDRDGALFYLRGLERDPEVRRLWPRYSSAGVTVGAVDVLSVEERLRQIEAQFKDDPTILRRLAWWYQGVGELDLALRQFDSVLRLRPGLPGALFERGRCRRQVRDKAGAAEDLLHYLQSPGFFVHAEMDADEDEHNGAEDAATALRELLDVSFEAFVEALASPGVLETGLILPPVGAYEWLNSAAEYLLWERRWKDAVQYLETDLPALINKFVSWPTAGRYYYEGELAWYLAMAQWGETGNLSSNLCRTSLELFRKGSGNFEGGKATDLQRMSLLYWGIGDAEKACALLDRALEKASKTGLISSGERGISNWTFREASAHEFCQHCEEQRRMIQGEPLRPAFLGTPRSPTPT